ncbi:hypothetical protein [Thermobrachium celere]|uniref:Uncharacterized protein n=1 Tax=Thermobrachium celere DSM 8682 TaxID=941824 RepID=R7RU35_9CLOT|nr:hypothetical protein [Thermobrachium celere]CDF58795.1 hypothetical protein TCEL_01014 [Thermobrachium celere DSM 8682]
MYCIRLLQKPCDNKDLEYNYENIIYDKYGIIGLELNECANCLKANVLKKIKARSLIINNYLFDKISRYIKDYGYDVESVLTEEGDVLKIRCTSIDNYVEISYCGVVSMQDIDLELIDEFVPLLLGDD